MIHLRRTRLRRIDDICTETLLATIFLILLSRYIENNVEEDKRLFLFVYPAFLSWIQIEDGTVFFFFLPFDPAVSNN